MPIEIPDYEIRDRESLIKYSKFEKLIKDLEPYGINDCLNCWDNIGFGRNFMYRKWMHIKKPKDFQLSDFANSLMLNLRSYIIGDYGNELYLGNDRCDQNKFLLKIFQCGTGYAFEDGHDYRMKLRRENMLRFIEKFCTNLPKLGYSTNMFEGEIIINLNSNKYDFEIVMDNTIMPIDCRFPDMKNNIERVEKYEDGLDKVIKYRGTIVYIKKHEKVNV
ncbi:hypothetical protein ACFL1H_02390 [Nanoarchaeota archaeon]